MRVLLQVDFTDCRFVSAGGAERITSMPPLLPATSTPAAADDKSRKGMLSCALKPRGDHEPSLEALRHQLEPIYKAFEARCPQLFRPAGTVPAYGQRVVSAYYMETGISLNVVKCEITYYAVRQPVDTFIGNVGDASRVVDRFACMRPRDGSREF